MTTKEVEKIVYNNFKKIGWYGLFEMAVPRSICNKYHRERVDFVSYETTGIWRFYEIKISVNDFYSSAALTWIGHYNYYILTENVWEKVKNEIPNNIGVWVVYNKKSIKCVKKPKKQELKCKHEDLLFSLMQGLSREYRKYRKLI